MPFYPCWQISNSFVQNGFQRRVSTEILNHLDWLFKKLKTKALLLKNGSDKTRRVPAAKSTTTSYESRQGIWAANSLFEQGRHFFLRFPWNAKSNIAVLITLKVKNLIKNSVLKSSPWKISSERVLVYIVQALNCLRKCVMEMQKN